MTIKDFIWDILEIKNAIEDDSDLEQLWILYKINMYRSAHIRAEYGMTNEINAEWLQRIHKFKWEKTDPADDPAITLNTLTLGKYDFPRVVKLPGGQGLYRLSGSGGITTFDPVDFNQLIMKAELNDTNQGYGCYSHIGDRVYIWPYTMEGSAMVIAEDPTQVQINDNGTLRDMTWDDEYPLDMILAQRVVLDFLQKDMALKEGTITDIINDSQDQLRILKDGANALPNNNRKG